MRFRRRAPLELSRVLKRLGRLMERCLSSVEGSLEKFYQVTHFPRAESWIEIYIYIF